MSNNNENYNFFLDEPLKPSIYMDYNKKYNILDPDKNILFFDDDINQIINMNKYYQNIQSIHVKHVEIPNYNNLYIFKDNFYSIANFDPQYSYAVVGLNDFYIEKIIEWSSFKLKKKLVLFDFDHVINRVNGILCVDEIDETLNMLRQRLIDIKNEKIVDKDFEVDQFDICIDKIVEYLVGGKERLYKLNRLDRVLKDNNTDIFILTNNICCGSECFYVIVKKIFPSIKIENLICSYNSIFKGYHMKNYENNLINIYEI